MVLAHLLIKQTYQTFYQTADGFKILDNGEAEGSRVPASALIDCALSVGANEIVVPDVMCDCAATIERARAYQRHAHPAFQYMGVVQGTSVTEWLKCINAFDALGYITTLGFPRNMNRKYRQQRVLFLQSLHEMGWFAEHRPMEIHCLGASPAWVKEVTMLADLPVVRSIDTSAPAVYALQLQPISETGLKLAREPGFFEEVLTSGQEHMYDRNIATYFDWAGYQPWLESTTPGGTL